MIIHRHITDPIMQVNTYLAVCGATRAGVLIDPGKDCSAVFMAIQDHQIEVQYIINTHAHPDHCHGNAEAHQRYGAPVLLHAMEHRRLQSMTKAKFIPDGEYSCRFVADGEVLVFGNAKLTIIETPGHTDGSISLWSQETLFCGDLMTVNAASHHFGGMNFENSQTRDTYFRILLPRIQTQPDIVIYPGHGPAFKPQDILRGAS
ncbi:MAG: MBL fold metallo-hydrolase [Desulfobacteraceae bacterium]|nr:MBL fold metallo-hydrolase [Desulfobacteraceae bacterium]